MLFLVEMELMVPPDYDPALRADLVQRERKRAAEIAADGSFFKHAWIVPGRRARINICSARDAAHLHETYTSLPAFKFTDLTAHALIECPVGEPIAMSK